MDELSKCGANYVALTPTTFLKRASMVYANRASVIYANVSVLAPNTPALYEMHFAVPMAGAVLNAINTRLDANNIATILRHSEAKMLFVDYEYVPVARDALRLLISQNYSCLPLVIVIDDIDSPTGIRLGELEYEQLVRHGDPSYEEDLLKHCHQNLPKYMVPKKIQFLNEIPKTATGKPRKTELREIAKTLVISEKPAAKKPTNKGNSRPNYNGHETHDQVLAMSRL
uniref:AMP-binding enzyme C-terminal domain-containing protein n=1 Tax=Daucus carota subsp. sativus TaxID=79200 RepID=A0A164XQ47_DAUCS